MNMRHWIMLAAVVITISCSDKKPEKQENVPSLSNTAVITQSKATQSGMTTEDAVRLLKEGNKRFVNNQTIKRDYLKQVTETKDGQYPFAVVVSCMDSRTSSEIIFDQGIGDIFNLRVAGNISNDDILGSIEYGAKVAGAKLIAVIGHSHCGAVKGACDDVKVGNITKLVGKIRPVVETTPDHGKGKNSKNHHFVEEVAKGNVLSTMKEIREKSPLLAEMLDKGEIAMIGGMYDIDTGLVEFYDGTEKETKKH